MYRLEPDRGLYAAPWDLTISQRMSIIYEAKQYGQKVAVYLYEAADTSTFRYRVYNVYQSMQLSSKWKVTYFFYNELDYVKKILSEIDLMILARCRWTMELDDVIYQAKNRGLKLAFDVDDMVYDKKYIPVIMNTLAVKSSDVNYNYWFSYTGRLNETVKRCDAMITTNQYLADMMRQDLKRPAHIIQNYLNYAQMKVSENYFEQKKEIPNEGKFTIGYFSGTPSHINDFRMVAPEIAEFLRDHKDAVMEIVGFMELPQFMDEFAVQNRVKRLPLMNFVELQKAIAEVDVNIAPLVNNEFSNCKSELKYFEAAVVGTPTCATPTYTFRDSIMDGKTGFLCQPGQWYDTLVQLYREKPDMQSSLVQEAHDYCIDRYAYYNQVFRINQVFDEIVG